MTCPKCRAHTVTVGGDGFVTCALCGTEIGAPPMMPVDKWPGGIQPPPQGPPKPRPGNREAKPPEPGPAWRGALSTKALSPRQAAQLEAKRVETWKQAVFGKPTGKEHVAPVVPKSRKLAWRET